MSRENVEIVQDLLDVGFHQGTEAVIKYLDPEVRVDWSESDGPYSGSYSGHDGFRELFDGFRDTFEDYWMEPHEFITAGPHVVVPNTSHFRGRSGAEVIARGTLVYTLSRGKIVSIKLFQDRDEALEAAGLSE